MEPTIQATEVKLMIRQRTVSGMRTTKYLPYYGAAIINEGGSVLDNRWSWNPQQIEEWVASFGLSASFALHSL